MIKRLSCIYIFCSFFFINSYCQISVNKDSLIELGNKYFAMVNDSVSPPENIIHIQNAKREYKKAENWKYYILCSIHLSLQLIRDKRINEAIPIIDKSLEEIELYNLKDSLTHGYILHNKATMLDEKGEYIKAIQLFNKSIEIEKLNNSEDLSIGATYNSMAYIYMKMGDNVLAHEYFKKSVEYMSRTIDEYMYYVVGPLTDLARSHFKMKDTTSAIKIYEEAFSLANKFKGYDYVKQPVCYAYYELAEYYLETDNPSKANIYIDLAEAINEETTIEKRFNVYKLKGKYFEKTSNKAKAEQAYLKSIEVAQNERNSYKAHLDKSDAHKALAQFYNSNNELEKSKFQYTKAMNELSVADSINPDILSFDLNDLINKYYALDIIIENIKNYKLQSDSPKVISNLYAYMHKLFSETKNTISAQNSRINLNQKAQDIYSKAIAFEAKNNVETSFIYSEAIRANLLFDDLVNSEIKKQNLISKEEFTSIDSLEKVISFLNKSIFDESAKKNFNNERIKKWSQSKFLANDQLQKIKLDLQSRYPKYQRQNFNAFDISLEKIQLQLKPAETIIEYFVGEDKLYAFALTKNKINVLPIDDIESIKNNVSDLIHNLSTPPTQNASKSTTEFIELSYTVFNQILSPLLPVINENTNSLIIIPDGILSFLPFEALVSKKGNFIKNSTFLLEDYNINYQYSASLWSFLKEKETKKINSSLAMVSYAPSFNQEDISESRDCTEGEMYSLMCSNDEALSVSEIFGGEVIAGKNATKISFYEKAIGKDIIHLATHACANEDNFNFNKIYFQDDYVSNNDLANLDFSASLAVLSACNTGAGQYVEGEGVMSLSKGFFQAGIPSTLISLWSIDDCTSSELMNNFYQYLKNGNEKDEAIRLAKLDYLNEAHVSKQHPYYWAAFVQTGLNDPVINNASVGKYFLIGGIVFLLLSYLFFKHKAKST